MRRTIVLLSTMALTLLVASGVALAAAIGSAGAQSSVVGPGESIQKAINAADPGDTIVVRGVHREDVVIRKDGIKLRGDDAVIEVPARAKADSPCSRAFGPGAICVLGDVNVKTGELTGQRQRVSDVSVSGFTIRGFKDTFMIEANFARNATVEGNRITGDVLSGIAFVKSVNTTIAKNHVIGSPETAEVGILVELSSRTKIVNNVVRSIPEGHFAIEAIESRDTTIAGNDLIGNGSGMLVIESTGTEVLSNDITDSTVVGMISFDSTGTKIVSNDISRSGETGITILGPKRANNDAKVVGNNISGGPWGIYVTDAHRGSFAGNTIRNNCAGMFFEAFPSQPVGGFEVKANTVEDNTRSCRGAQFDRNFSGIGIALLGASGMEVAANHISGNVPSGPSAVSGGVVVSTDPFFGGTIKPKNNSVIGNRFGRNKPDIFWDESGSGNRFVGNICNSSVPHRLCSIIAGETDSW
jgi:parallel beta-helix repeat protein